MIKKLYFLILMILTGFYADAQSSLTSASSIKKAVYGSSLFKNDYRNIASTNWFAFEGDQH